MPVICGSREPYMRIVEREVGNVTVLDLEGKLTLGDGAPEFREAVDALVAAGRVKVVFGLQKLGLLDSSGLGEIVRAHTSMTSRGGGVRMLQPTDRTAMLLKITKLSTVLPSFDSEEAAVRSFS
jgi:anti-sigma B factor antagonist